MESCKINEQIVRVRLQLINWFGGFVTGVEFHQESGESCTIGQITRVTHTLQHPGYYLSYLSGGLDTWRWTGGSTQCINGLTFHWRQIGGSTQPTSGTTSGILTTTSPTIGSIGYYEKFVKYFVDNFTECRCGVSKQNMGRIIGGNYVVQVCLESDSCEKIDYN